MTNLSSVFDDARAAYEAMRRPWPSDSTLIEAYEDHIKWIEEVEAYFEPRAEFLRGELWPLPALDAFGIHPTPRQRIYLRACPSTFSSPGYVSVQDLGELGMLNHLGVWSAKYVLDLLQRAQVGVSLPDEDDTRLRAALASQLRRTAPYRAVVKASRGPLT